MKPSSTQGQGKTIAVVVLLAIAVIALAWVLWPSPQPSAPAAGAAESSVTPAKPRTRRAVRAKNERYAVEVDAIDPTIHLELLANSEDVSYRGNGRNIFESTAEAEEVAHLAKPPVKIDPCAVTPDAPQCQTGPPPPPPIDLKFYGFASKPGEAKKIFLSRGDDIFVAKEGDIVNRRYKIVKIGVTSVQIEDVSNNNTQTIPLTQG